MEPEEPEIPVQKLSETESRLFALLFLLLRNPQGVSFATSRKKMPQYYFNEEIESDRKKFQRDLKELKELGFNIKVATYGFESKDNYPYYLEKESLDSQLHFSKEELSVLTNVFLFSENQDSNILKSLAQKIFSQDISLFPKNVNYNQVHKEWEEEESQIVQILQSIKNKNPLVIQYGEESSRERTIEPLRLVRKNSEDFYLIAFDREKKELRTFIVPRIRIKKELKESFVSTSKGIIPLSSLHPLGVKKHEEIAVRCQISSEFLDLFEMFLKDFPFQKESNWFSFACSNVSALFPLIAKHPMMFQEILPSQILNDWSEYKTQWKELYDLESQ